MPLMSISPNIQELDSPGRKRSHDAYSEEEVPSKGLPQLKSEQASGTGKRFPATSNLFPLDPTPSDTK
ncbi:hypothetical protein VMCG_04586 [Cytospora schulzeri]|uniref:Uncharacterized protein n=1 Tax=Cytospora schulzeri TaxID=448051 RepID=A0A423WRG7_9PEZI|nr:hypothetical protein VMCG_04586 [Valsa malicola]